MPPARRIEEPAADSRTLYRRGLAQSHRGELLALQTLASALVGLRKAQDAAGAALAAAALLITGQCMSNYRRFHEHAAALAGLRDGSLDFVDRQDELVAQAGLLCALLFLNPSDDAIDPCVGRIMALLELDLDVNVRFAAGLRSLADAGRHWERRERWADAIELYERGIEVDTLAEDLYRKLMRCHLAQGQPPEAARVYRRCRDMLSVQLGIAPSAETEALFKSIYGKP